MSTMPTAKGKEEIDAFHPLYGLHYLERKATQDFLSGTGPERSQWLQIEKGKVCGVHVQRNPRVTDGERMVFGVFDWRGVLSFFVQWLLAERKQCT